MKPALDYLKAFGLSLARAALGPQADAVRWRIGPRELATIFATALSAGGLGTLLANAMSSDPSTAAKLATGFTLALMFAIKLIQGEKKP